MKFGSVDIELGRQYRDRIHGIEGIAVSHIRYITGCDQVNLERVVNGEVKNQWVDVTRLEGVELDPEENPGGPAPSSLPPARHP